MERSPKLRPVGPVLSPERKRARPEKKRSPEEVFSAFLPGSHLRAIELTDVPPAALEEFERLARLYVNQDTYQPYAYRQVFTIDHLDGSRSFAVSKEKKYGHEEEKGEGSLPVQTEISTFVVDADAEGALLGHGEIRYNVSDPSAYFLDKPFVGYIKTEDYARRGGLGLRRLETMNALAQAQYGRPLHSDTLVNEKARSLWERLVASGRARKFKEGKYDRYVFEVPTEK